MESKKICIFACGGHGLRMGREIPKQFIRIGGKTILQLSMERVLDALGTVKSIVVLPEEYVEWWREECKRMNFIPPQTLVKGGITRFHSVRNALEKVRGEAVVGIHDGVRPLCSVQLVRRLFEEAAEYGSAVPVIPVTDTLKVLERRDDGSFAGVPGAVADRNVLFGAQTPQVFRSEMILSAYSNAFNPAFTDDASVVEAAGKEIHYIDGERNNLKITTEDDLLLARFLLGL